MALEVVKKTLKTDENLLGVIERDLTIYENDETLRNIISLKEKLLQFIEKFDSHFREKNDRKEKTPVSSCYCTHCSSYTELSQIVDAIREAYTDL